MERSGEWVAQGLHWFAPMQGGCKHIGWPCATRARAAWGGQAGSHGCALAELPIHCYRPRRVAHLQRTRGYHASREIYAWLACKQQPNEFLGT